MYAWMYDISHVQSPQATAAANQALDSISLRTAKAWFAGTKLYFIPIC